MAAPEQINSTTDGTTPKQAAAADNSRQLVIIQSHDEDLGCNFLGAAGINVGFVVHAGETAILAESDFPMIKNALSVASETEGSRYGITGDIN